MKKRSTDRLVLIDGSDQPREAIENLVFVPPLRIEQVAEPPDPQAKREEPLLYLLGETESLPSAESILGWLDDLAAASGAPVAFLLPRVGPGCYPAAMHPQFCGLIPCQTHIPIEAMEQALHHARRAMARMQSRRTVRRARISWTYSTREAADGERIWLGIESALAGLAGPGLDFSRLGMAFAEALTNAVEHGNLELDSSIKDATDGGLLHFFRERERRLRQRRFSRRRIEVTAELQGTRINLTVSNQGNGFHPATVSGPRAAGSPGLPHGMGFGMIECLVDRYSISADGRTVTLDLDLSGAARESLSLVPGEILQADPMRPAA